MPELNSPRQTSLPQPVDYSAYDLSSLNCKAIVNPQSPSASYLGPGEGDTFSQWNTTRDFNDPNQYFQNDFPLKGFEPSKIVHIQPILSPKIQFFPPYNFNPETGTWDSRSSTFPAT